MYINSEKIVEKFFTNNLLRQEHWFSYFDAKKKNK